VKLLEQVAAVCRTMNDTPPARLLDRLRETGRSQARGDDTAAAFFPSA